MERIVVTQHRGVLGWLCSIDCADPSYGIPRPVKTNQIMNKFCLSSVFVVRVLPGTKTCQAQEYFFTILARLLPVPITTENNFKSNVRFRRQTARLESGDLL
jgi:hypothetical protein